MKSAVIVFPGSNCDQDVAKAISKVTGHPPIMLWYQETTLPASLDLVVLPGGFSYGDYLRSGAIAARSPIMQAISAGAEQGLAVLGICNGFQILTEARLLPGALTRNNSLSFRARMQPLKVESTNSPFTRNYSQGQLINLPIAHGDGCYVADADTIKQLADHEQIAFTYSGDNPNGSVANIAGVFNSKRNILGLMPHPERVIDKALSDNLDGQPLFTSLLNSFA